MPDAQRQGVVHAWVTDLMIADAPREFIEAVACLIDDALAEKAYEVIYQCGRGDAGKTSQADPGMGLKS